VPFEPATVSQSLRCSTKPPPSLPTTTAYPFYGVPGRRRGGPYFYLRFPAIPETINSSSTTTVVLHQTSSLSFLTEAVPLPRVPPCIRIPSATTACGIFNLTSATNILTYPLHDSIVSNSRRQTTPKPIRATSFRRSE